MKAKVLFFIFIFLSIAIWLATKVYAGTKLVYKILSPQSLKVDFAKFMVTWIQPVEITNPTNTGILLRLIQFDVNVSGDRLGSGFTNETTIIKALEKTVLNVPCTVSILDVLYAFPDLIGQISSKKIKVNLKGNINAEGFTIAINTDSVIQFPNLSIFKK